MSPVPGGEPRFQTRLRPGRHRPHRHQELLISSFHVRRLLLLTSLFILLALPLAGADDKVDGFVAHVYKNNRREQMPYRLFVPTGYDKSKRYPVVIWLHGAGGAGEDNLLNISGDQVPGTRLWTKTENQSRHPAFVLVPQSTGGW